MISYVIPFNNDGERIPLVLEKLKLGIDKYPIKEVLFIQNGKISIDLDLKNKIESTHPYFKFLMTPKKGIGAGYRLGIQNATSDYILLSASDLPFEFTDLENILKTKKLDQHYKPIFLGSKLHKESKINRKSLTRQCFSWFFYFYRRILFGSMVPLDCQGTSLFPRETAQLLIAQFHDDDYIFSFKITMLAEKLKYPIFEIPVTLNECLEKSNVSLLKDGFNLLKKVIIFRIFNR